MFNSYFKTEKNILKSTMLSVLSYGDILHAHAAADASFKPLDAVDHSAIRFITADSYCTHYGELCKGIITPVPY